MSEYTSEWVKVKFASRMKFAAQMKFASRVKFASRMDGRVTDPPQAIPPLSPNHPQGKTLSGIGFAPIYPQYPQPYYYYGSLYTSFARRGSHAFHLFRR
jgi:hypothetical protein